MQRKISHASGKKQLERFLIRISHLSGSRFCQ